MLNGRYEPTFDDKKMIQLANKQVMREARRDRILDTGTRNALDKDFLEQQMKTADLTKAYNRIKQLEEDEKLLMINKYLAEQEREFLRLKFLKERQDLQFSLDNMRRDQSRDWDLNDPQRLRKQAFTRVDQQLEDGTINIDPKLGVSSGQVFHGEDLYQQQRMRAQAEQFRYEMETENARKAAQAAEDARNKMDDDLKEIAVVNYVADSEKAQAQQRRDMAIAQRQENERLAKQAEEERLNSIKQNDLEAQQAASNFQNTRMMREFARPGIVDEFKGFERAQVEQFNCDLEQQVKDAQLKRRKDMEEKVMQEELELNVNRKRALMEQEFTRDRANMAYQLAYENKLMAEQQNTKKFNDTYDLGKNKIGEDFYKGFQKSER
ncbi:RIB43A domain-containing protein [Spironucleus salmonicida]|uniref:RIB43A domain-containing protein n=1 Tax=Spironucleus salmonicida TaxID=348837 RepID=V6LP07_9EUKA|nr:RIB43A domain-containing protein [Spironucleus salmonicida]|eukprot:EST46407.1 RIB43A domain-containing protein [Spironucleus salmonicida]